MTGLTQHPEISNEKRVDRGEYSLKANEGIGNVANAFGIRQTYLEQTKDLGTLRKGDLFYFSINSDGSGTLRKMRIHNLEPGERKIDAKYHLPREAVYQDIERGPEEFPYITFARDQARSIYRIQGKNSEEIGTIDIPVQNLDLFRDALKKVSSAFIIECGGRKEQYELACSITPKRGFGKNVFEINSTNWYDKIPTSVDIQDLAKLTRSDGQELAKCLARSLPIK